MRFYIVDAFTETIFGGNPAGIVLLENGADFPDDEIMLKTAAELRYSESAFIKPLPNQELHIRYFTPVSEVNFCGHATIATFAALLKSGFVKNDHVYPIHTRAGVLNIEIADDFVLMEMPEAKLIKDDFTSAEINALYQSLGIEYKPVHAVIDGETSVALLPQLISAGFDDIFMPVESREALAAISPDYKALSDLTKKHGAGGVHAFTLDTPGNDVIACTRNFAPLVGIDEEPATGTGSGGLAYYLYCHGISLGENNCCFLQGESMGRPSKIFFPLRAHPDFFEIKVGGKGAVLAEGEIYL